MFPEKSPAASGHRLTAVALATLAAVTVTLAGCSLNPFAAEDERDAAPVAAPRTTTAASGSSARTQARAETTYEPQLVQQTASRVPLAQGHPDEYVVQPGDTLWSSAGAIAPGTDVRITVDQLVTLNGGSSIVPGQELVLPG
jgi:Tfp pilus assembly protein FimV